MGGIRSFSSALPGSKAARAENPLINYFLAAQRRQSARISFVQRHASWIAALLIAVVASAATVYMNHADDYRTHPQQIIGIFVISVVFGAGLFYLQALLNLVSGALSVLGTASGPTKNAAPQLDEQLAVTPLQDEDILIASLRLLLPPMLLPLGVALTACFGFLLLSEGDNALLHLPQFALMIAMSILGGLLALPICALFFISISGRLSQITCFTAARAFALLQFVWLLPAYSAPGVFANEWWHYQYSSSNIDPLKIILLLAGIVLAGLLFQLQFNLRLTPRWLKAHSGPFLPVLLLLGVVATVYVLDSLLGLWSGHSVQQNLSPLLLGLSWAQGAVFPFNPQFCDLLDEGYFYRVYLADTSFGYRMAALPFLQLWMLYVAWHAALRNVNRMRRAV